VSSLGGKCPALSFTAAGRTVATDLLTLFGHGTCGDLSDSDTIQIDGTTTGAVSVRAGIIDFKK
jgi:hypothetical protein